MAPTLTLLGRPSFTEGHRQFLSNLGLSWEPCPEATDAEALIEFSGRVCYMSFSPNPHTEVSTSEYIRKLIHNGHESVLEHAQWTFLLDGVTRGFSHQLVRHRVGFAFSQLSQQYHDEAKADILLPEGLELNEELARNWRSVEDGIHKFYEKAVELAKPQSQMSGRERVRYIRSLARSLLPNATRTILSVSANARSLRHFMDVRGGLDGDIEMRRVSALIYDMLMVEAPAIVSEFKKTLLEDGSPKIAKRN